MVGMTDGPAGDSTTSGTLEPPRMSPAARFLGVFASPGKVFEDVRRNPSGWWLPILVSALAWGLFGSLYLSRYDMGLVLREQIKESSGMKIMGLLAGGEMRDKAIDGAVQAATATPTWQLQCGNWVNTFFGFALVVWFFTFLYSLIAVLMGWLRGTRASRIWMSLGIIALVIPGFVLYGVASAVSQAAAAKKAGAGGPTAAPPPTSVALLGLAVAVIAIALVFWALSRLAREGTLGRVVAAVSFGMAPAALAAVVGMIIVFFKAPDATPLTELVPSNLSALLNLKDTSAVLAALGSSLDLFSIWSIVLTIIGLAKGLERKTSEAAALVMVPWLLVVVIKVGAAAVLG